MGSIRTGFLIILLSFMLGGCGNRLVAPRTTNPVIEDRVRAGDSDEQKMSVLSMRADRRTVLILGPERICAEPPPDVAEALSSQAKIDLKTKGIGIGAGSSLQTAIQQLTRRSQGLELFRTTSFVLCNMYINKLIEKADYVAKLDMAFGKSVELIKEEIGNLPQIASALQVVGAAELKLASEPVKPATPD